MCQACTNMMADLRSSATAKQLWYLSALLCYSIAPGLLEGSSSDSGLFKYIGPGSVLSQFSGSLWKILLSTRIERCCISNCKTYHCRTCNYEWIVLQDKIGTLLQIFLQCQVLSVWMRWSTCASMLTPSQPSISFPISQCRFQIQAE